MDQKKQEVAGKNYFLDWVMLLVSLLALPIIVNQIFHLGLFKNFISIESSFLYILLGLYGSIVFLKYPIKKGDAYSKGIYFCLDITLFVVFLFFCILFATKALEMTIAGWVLNAPMPYPILGLVFWVILMEAVRRSQGLFLTVFIVVISLYPLYAEFMPSFLEGIRFGLMSTASYHAFSIDSIIGLPLKVICNIVAGFIIFGVILVATGGGKFFMDFALSILGTTRGGAAKVSVLSSALFGSLSGSVASNVITTGSFTIPAMVRTGFPKHIAAAVEAVASTGSVLMPPVMGATAFLIAEFLSIPYLTVAAGAVIPSILYYTGLLVQVDAHAAINNLHGLSKDQLPALFDVLKKGWYYLGAVVILVILLLLRTEEQGPFYASIFLLVCTNFKKETRLNIKMIKKILLDIINALSGLMVLCAGVGMIVGSLTVTGVAHALTSELVHCAGNNVLFLVIMGAVASFILGMGVTVTACYILLAITIAPSLIQMGLDPLAVHLFIMYCGTVSFITLPVAIAVYTAAGFIGANSLSTGIAAMRLGIATYMVPFFLVYNASLVLRGTIMDIFIFGISSLLGIYLVASSVSGYMPGVGRLTIIAQKGKVITVFLRIITFIIGFIFAIPNIPATIVGFVLSIALVLSLFYLKKVNKLSSV